VNVEDCYKSATKHDNGSICSGFVLSAAQMLRR